MRPPGPGDFHGPGRLDRAEHCGRGHQPYAAGVRGAPHADARRALPDPGVHTHTPQGAFYAFPSYDADIPSTELVRHVREYGVAVRPGSEFGGGCAGSDAGWRRWPGTATVPASVVPERCVDVGCRRRPRLLRPSARVSPRPGLARPFPRRVGAWSRTPGRRSMSGARTGLGRWRRVRGQRSPRGRRRPGRSRCGQPCRCTGAGRRRSPCPSSGPRSRRPRVLRPRLAGAACRPAWRRPRARRGSSSSSAADPTEGR